MDFTELRKMIKGRMMEAESMTKHTSYGIGGPASVYIEPKSVKDIQSVLFFANENELPFYCIGSGSNLLVSDQGIDGIVISLEKSFRKILFDGNTCFVGTGIKLSKLVRESIKRNLGGFETLMGIPGTLGGALKMNAGAFGNEISNKLVAVELINKKGEVERKSVDEIDFGYRSTSFNDSDILLCAEFLLDPGEESEIHYNRKRANSLRKKTQPLKYRSAGSVFKNPEGDSAGYLIDNTGLKGTSIGGVSVSELHANFIINDNEGSAEDVLQLIKIIQDTVWKKYSIVLELEINTLGFPLGTFDA